MRRLISFSALLAPPPVAALWRGLEGGTPCFLWALAHPRRNESTQKPPFVGGAATPPAAAVTAVVETVAQHPGDDGAANHHRELEERLRIAQATEQFRALSEDDQRRIVTALEHPEGEKSSRLGGPGVGTKNGDMVAAFTCGRCDFRMVKRFSKHAYTKGIVIVECPNCEVRHLLADNLGWFVDESRNIEDILREKGESFIRIGQDMQVVPGDVVGNPAPPQ